MTKLGDWSKHDNKKYIGKLDRDYVAASEPYEIEHFIDHFLDTNGLAVDNANRDYITRLLEEYQGRPPYKREDLAIYLGMQITKMTRAERLARMIGEVQNGKGT